MNEQEESHRETLEEVHECSTGETIENLLFQIIEKYRSLDADLGEAEKEAAGQVVDQEKRKLLEFMCTKTKEIIATETEKGYNADNWIEVSNESQRIETEESKIIRFLVPD